MLVDSRRDRNPNYRIPTCKKQPWQPPHFHTDGRTAYHHAPRVRAAGNCDANSMAGKASEQFLL